MKSLLRSILHFATLGLIGGNRNPAKPRTTSSNAGKSLTADQIRSLFDNSFLPRGGGIGNIDIRIASRTTNQRKRRKNFRRAMAAGAA